VRITALERQPRRRRVNLHIDESFAFSVGLDVCVQFGLRVGDDVTEARLSEIREAQARGSTMESALRLLAYRPRSESELRRRLAARGTEPNAVEQTLARLRESGLVNDEESAAILVENRDRASPRGKRLIASELRAKGIDRDITARAVAALEDEAAAHRAGARRAKSLGGLSAGNFKRRLTEFLLRRGFDTEVSAATAGRLWREAIDENRQGQRDNCQPTLSV